MRSFHHPAPRLVSRVFPLEFYLFATLPNMRDIALPTNRLLCRLARVSLIRAQVLLDPRPPARALHHQVSQGWTQQLNVVTVSSADDERQRDSILVDEEAALGPIFFPDPSGWAPPLPSPVAPSPWRHRCFARPRQSLPFHRMRPVPCATAGQRRPDASTPGNTYGRNWRCRSVPWARLSIGNQCAERKRWPRRLFAVREVCARLPNGVGIFSLSASGVAESTARLFPREHPIPPMNVLLSWSELIMALPTCQHYLRISSYLFSGRAGHCGYGLGGAGVPARHLAVTLRNKGNTQTACHSRECGNPVRNKGRTGPPP